MLVLGDAHADDPTRRRALMRAYAATDQTAALQTGDLLTYDLPIETYFIAGNNEDFDIIERLRDGEKPSGVSNAHLLASTATEVEGLRIAGLSGNFAPTRFEKSRDDLQGDRRRHFVRADVDRAASLENIDIVLTHEAPHGVVVEESYDVGCKHVDRILESVEPDLCLVGHHHQHAESTFGPTRVVSLAPAWESYYELTTESLELNRYRTPEQE